MKSLFAALSLLIFAFIYSGCSNSSTNGNDPFNPGGGGNTGNITFTTSVVQDQQNNTFFRFAPSADVTLDSIVVNCAALGITNVVVTGDHQTVFNAQNPMDLGPITGLAQGQEWTFKISGKQGTSQGTGYSTTFNYTVQQGGGGGGNITFNTQIVEDQQQNKYFRFTPSANVTLDSITVNCPALGITNVVVQGDHTTVFSAQNPMDLGPITGLAAGQQWTFLIRGRQGNAQGAGYSTTVNYTVQ